MEGGGLRPRPESSREKFVLLAGELVESVEGGHVVLRTDDGSVYTLSGPGRAELIGASGPVTVQGRVDPDLMSTAMQGPLFVVTRVVAWGDRPGQEPGSGQGAGGQGDGEQGSGEPGSGEPPGAGASWGKNC